ncbi:hypothetical protein PV04_00204 [Phialophora macrospora]|uniref:Uncharacterized protein n=1 Tax=Phialophora macrospora TaxID=1851006 RepID=A0A0D2GI38_9EURO|nr:hypothetical protein PV04_00204 [Phialophora macrospora]
MPPKRGPESRRSAPAAVPAEMGSLDDDFTIENDEYGAERDREREQKMKISTAVDLPVRTRIEVFLTNFQTHRKRVRDGFATRLLALTRKKAILEQQIVQHVQELAQAYEEVREEFQAVVKGRSEDIQEAINALGELQGTGNANSDEQD